MITDYSKIEEDHKVLTDFLNKVYYPDNQSSIQEYLFNKGLEFCNERPKFYTECESFWNYYIREFYDRMYFILFTSTIKNRANKALYLYENYNQELELPDFIREDIFIEYSTKIDQKIKPKTKITQSGTKKKKVHLKQI